MDDEGPYTDGPVDEFRERHLNAMTAVVMWVFTGAVVVVILVAAVKLITWLL